MLADFLFVPSHTGVKALMTHQLNNILTFLSKKFTKLTNSDPSLH